MNLSHHIGHNLHALEHLKLSNSVADGYATYGAAVNDVYSLLSSISNHNVLQHIHLYFQLNPKRENTVSPDSWPGIARVLADSDAFPCLNTVALTIKLVPGYMGVENKNSQPRTTEEFELELSAVAKALRARHHLSVTREVFSLSA